MQQRKFERFSVTGRVNFIGDSVQGEGQIENLSLGGAAITSDVSVARGEYLQLKITLADQPLIDVELAPVRWIKEHSFGVEFIRVSPTGLKLLRHYVERLDSAPEQPTSSTL